MSVPSIFTREDAHRALAALHPAKVFLDSYSGKHLPENLDIHFGPPEELFIAADTQQLYTGGRLVPILDDGNFGEVVFVDPGTSTLVLKYIEEPDPPAATYRHWAQYLAHLMLRVLDTVEENDRLHRIAKLIEFTRLDELLALVDGLAGCTVEEYREATARFVDELGDGRPAVH